MIKFEKVINKEKLLKKYSKMKCPCLPKRKTND